MSRKKKYDLQQGAGDEMTPKLQEASRMSTTGRQQVHIPELRMSVWTRKDETPEQTRQRYLEDSYKKRHTKGT